MKVTDSNAAESNSLQRKSGNCWIRATLYESTLFGLFLLSYFFPLLLSPPSLSVVDPRVKFLLEELFNLPSTRLEIFRNTGGLIAGLLIVFLLFSKAGKEFAKATQIAQPLGQLAALLTGWILLFGLNAMLFPLSNYAYALPALRLPTFTYISGFFSICSIMFLIPRNWPFKRRSSLILTGVALLACGAAFIPIPNSSSAKSANNPNIIIVGVDSLSSTMFRELHGYLPNLNKLMTSGERYTRAYTPLGRTFPAWMTILSGRYAADHGGVYNLRSLNSIQRRGLISSSLQQHGYRTVYAIDERRFNNIDASFGFDIVIGPKAGALDFLVQGFNDNPVANLLAQTSLAKFIMPYSYINTESFVNYDANGFVDRVLSATIENKPLFLAVHFESAHFPYKTRYGRHEFSSDNSFWNDQANALTVVDGQIGQLMAGLKAHGRLENALVIVLSDHGESHGEIEGNIKIETLAGSTSLTSYGHGTTVLSDLQNHIIFDVTRYSHGKAADSIIDDQQVSLLDIAPLITKFLATGQVSIKDKGNGCILVETGVRFPATDDFKTLDEAAIAANAAGFYDIGQDGRLLLREDTLPQLVAANDIGWRCLDHITYFDASLKQFYSYKLNNSGTPIQSMQVPSEDKQKIDAYRAHLMASLNSKW